MKTFPALCAVLVLGVLPAAAEKVVEVSADDYPYLFTRKDLELYGLKLDASGASESTTLKTYDDGSRMLRYSYDTLGKEGFTEMFISVYVDFEDTAAKAKQTFQANLAALVPASKEQGLPCEKAEPVIKAGDETAYFLRKQGGETNGFLFSVRKGKVCYTILTSGLYNADGSLFRDEIRARLDKLGGAGGGQR